MNLTKVFQQQAVLIVGEKSTVTCGADTAGSLAGDSFKFYLKTETGTEYSFWVWFSVTGYTSANPVTGVFRGIPVVIAGGASAATVCAALAAALKADSVVKLLGVITTSSPDVVITGRWPHNTTNIADVSTGWTIVTTTAGSATVVVNIGAATAAGAYVVRPYRTKKLYLRKLVFSVADSAVTDGSLFGAIAALTNGFDITIRDLDAVTLATIAADIKTNGAAVSLGRATILGATMYQVEIDLVELFGGEIPVDGSLGQDLCFQVNDDLTGIVGIYCTAYGHYTATVD